MSSRSSSVQGSEKRSPPDTMSKIIVYEHFDLQGISREFTSSVSNLIQESFNDCISSLKVIGNPWVVYSDINFSGTQEVYEEGEYARVEHNDSISSLEMVMEDLTDPQITLYEHVNYHGRSIVLKNETNLCHGSFNDIASSHKPGKPTITAEVLWDKKEEHVKSVILDSICGLNHGEREQSFSTELCRDYEGSVTDNFSFSNATEITIGTSFSVNVEIIKGSKNLSLSKTFTVEKGSSNTRTEKKSVQISLPATVPPCSKFTVNVVRKEVDVTVPVKLTITTGSHSRDEFGEYRCQSGNSITTEYIEDKIWCGNPTSVSPFAPSPCLTRVSPGHHPTVSTSVEIDI
ncbi:hypothetical protein AOLI_G00154730 [Acnodon oligacanthus]